MDKYSVWVITGTRKFDRGLGQTLHDQLHWLDVPDRVLFNLAVTVHQCLNGRALYRICWSTASRFHLLAVPRFRLNTYDRLAFRIAWNFLQYFVRDSTSSTGFLGVYSKRTCFCNTGAPSSALGEVLGDSATAAIKMFGDKLVLRRNITAGCP